MSLVIQYLTRIQSALLHHFSKTLLLKTMQFNNTPFFIEELNINHPRFKSAPSKTGRLAYHPLVVLNVCVYVYFN